MEARTEEAVPVVVAVQDGAFGDWLVLATKVVQCIAHRHFVNRQMQVSASFHYASLFFQRKAPRLLEVVEAQDDEG